MPHLPMHALIEVFPTGDRVGDRANGLVYERLVELARGDARREIAKALPAGAVFSITKTRREGWEWGRVV